MKFGLFHEFPSRDGVTPEEMFEESFRLVDAAEELGIEEIWLAEYHFRPTRSVLSSPITVASAVATRTKRMRIGLAVYVLPLTNPVRIAEEVATVDHISLGRLDFGVGRSTFPNVYDGYGMPYGQSRDRFRECLDVILACWTGESFSYEGNYYQFNNVCVVPKPFQKPHPPVIVAATSAETFLMAGVRGYPILINAASRTFKLSGLGPDVGQYRKAWDEARHQGHPEVGLRVPIYVAETAERAYTEPQKSTMDHIRGIAQVVAASAVHSDVSPTADSQAQRVQGERLASIDYDEVLRDLVVYGTPEAVVERLQRLKEELSFTNLIYEVNFGCLIPLDLQLNSMRLIAEQVVPELN